VERKTLCCAVCGLQNQYAVMMRYAYVAAFVLACGCPGATGALAIGPTVDHAGVVRLDAEAGGGIPANANDITVPARAATGVWCVGVRLALAAGTHWGYAQGSFGGYVEYLRLGTPSASWGFHVGATVAFALSVARHENVLFGLYAGPDHLARSPTFDDIDGEEETWVTDGLDLNFRIEPSTPGAAGPWWQLGALYVRRGTAIDPGQ
jgi:hypothetical protein